MAASLRRLRSLRHPLLSLAARTGPPLSSRISSSGLAFRTEPAHIDQLGSVRELCSKDFEVAGSVYRLSGRSGSIPRGVDCSSGWRRDSSAAESDGFSSVVGVSVRGFAAKTKKSGGKSRGDDGGGQVISTAGPSAKETASRLMEAALNALSVELSKLRTGRATPGMLDHVNVMSHGVQTPLSHVAAVSVSNLETLTVMPYDTSMVKEVEKAIRNSPLKLNPVAEGEVLKVPIPKLTKEHIQTMSKLVGKAGETAKLSVRRARKDAMDIISKGGYSKDEVKRFEKEVEDVTKKYVKSVEEACKSKEKEILGNS